METTLLSQQILVALDFSESIVVLTNVCGNIEYVNKAFVDTYGYSKEEVLGQTPSILNTDYHDKAFYKSMWHTIESGQTWKGDFCNKKKNGDLVWEKATINPVKDSNNLITGYIAIKENVTRQRTLEKELQDDKLFLDELFNNAPVGIVIFQTVLDDKENLTDFIVIKSNPYAGKIVGRLGLVGLNASEFIPNEFNFMERATSMLGQRYSFEGHIVEVNKFVRFRSFPFGENKLCAFFYDVSPYKRTIEALEASEERYFSLVEDAPAMICRFDKLGVLSYVNQLFSKEFDKDPDQLMGENLFSFLRDQDVEQTQKAINTLSSSNPMVEIEHNMTLPNGEVKWQRWVYRALLNFEGDIIEYQSVGMDFTKLKTTEEALIEHRNKLNAIVNTTAAGIGVIDNSGNFKLVNHRFAELMGFDKPEDLYKINNFDITRSDFVNTSFEKIVELINGERNDFELEKVFVRKDGSEFWGDLHMSPIKNDLGTVVELISIVTDISRRKEYENQLEQSEAKLRESNATKDKLFSIIAHDVKNPFNAILGFSSLLQNNINSYSREEIRSFVAQILSASENVYKLLDDLLIWARTQLGQLKVNKEKVNIHGLVELSFNNFLTQAIEKEITLNNSIDQSVEINVDYEMLKMVFRNLIHNAIKFTMDKGEVKFTSSLAMVDNVDYCVISVKDTGIGIREEVLEVLFELDGVASADGTANEKGTGLGLHLGKELIEMNGGFMNVKSEVGKGTEFFIYLPHLTNS